MLYLKFENQKSIIVPFVEFLHWKRGYIFFMIAFNFFICMYIPLFVD